MSTVRLKNVAKNFGAVKVIEDLDLDIDQGEFLVLLGPSGCGKSTLLRMIAGLEDISGGEIWIGGAVVNDIPARDRSVAMVFQNYALYPHMTVAQNMGFALRMRDIPAAEIDRRVNEAADILDLAGLLDRYPRALSGGQRQRVAMGRAIVRDPNVFLFDEPLSNLDAKLRARMRVEIEELHRRIGATSVFVTHDQVEAMTMADRIVLMNGGVIQQAGSPVDLYDRPANLFVAGFIGTPVMNQVEGRIEANGQSCVLRMADDRILPLDAAVGLSNRHVVCGFRPEDTELMSASDGQATITAIENLGHQTIFHCRHGENQFSALMDRAEEPQFRIGESVNLQPGSGPVHLFEPQAGNRLN